MIYLVAAAAAQAVLGADGRRSLKNVDLVRRNYHNSVQNMMEEKQKMMVGSDGRPMTIACRHGKRMPGMGAVPVVCC